MCLTGIPKQTNLLVRDKKHVFDMTRKTGVFLVPANGMNN